MASTYLTWTPSGAGSTTKWTTSFWVKRANLGGTQELVANWGSGNDNTTVRFLSGNNLEIVDYQSSSVVMKRVTNRLFRDTSAWYHIVVNIDTNQSTANDRTKLYINGVQETSFSTTTNYSSGQAHKWNTTYVHNIGQSGGSAGYFDGSMSHIHFIDGTAYDASAFGETDATTGEWEAKTSPSVTYGNNGFFILKDGNGITDQSSNSNNFTLGGGTLTDLKDNPENVFATMNPLDKNDVVVLANGNTTSHSSDNTTWAAANRATLGIAKDKFYWEMKITGSGTANGLFFGVCADTVRLITNQGIQDSSTERAKGVLVFCDDGQYQLDTNSRASMTSAPAFNDVLGCAVDRDNNTVKFYKNGSQVGSIDISSSPLATCSHIMPFMINFYTNTKFNFNFGNGYFGTTAVTTNSGNGYAGAEGASKFNYTVPTGYSALSTKGLNE